MSGEKRAIRGIGMTSARTRERLVRRLGETGITNLAVLERIRSVPRHLFVDEALASRAYEDSALPIGLGQTISQPWVVALMTQALVTGTGPNPWWRPRIRKDGASTGSAPPARGRMPVRELTFTPSSMVLCR